MLTRKVYQLRIDNHQRIPSSCLLRLKYSCTSRLENFIFEYWSSYASIKFHVFFILFFSFKKYSRISWIIASWIWSTIFFARILWKLLVYQPPEIIFYSLYIIILNFDLFLPWYHVIVNDKVIRRKLKIALNISLTSPGK